MEDKDHPISNPVGPSSPWLSTLVTDAIWSISLPEGADKDHPFSNPVRPSSPPLSTLVYGRMLVIVAEMDLLRDHGISYYEALKKAGKDAAFFMTEGEDHVFISSIWNPRMLQSC